MGLRVFGNWERNTHGKLCLPGTLGFSDLILRSQVLR
jgi:hypothetical protein